MRRTFTLGLCLAAIWLVVMVFFPFGGDIPETGETPPEVYDISQTEEEPSKVHGISVVVDTHSDTMMKIVDNATWLPVVDIGNDTSLQVDIPKMLQGGLDVQYFAAFSSGYYANGQEDFTKANSRLLALINALYWTLDRNTEHMGLAKTVEDIEELAGNGRISAVLSIEGAYSLDEANGLELLGQYYDLGVRAIGLTWNYSNALGQGAEEIYRDGTPSEGGLTVLGEQVIREMNRLGIIIDVSHMNEDTFFDVLEISDAPVIASHSGVYSLRNHIRNLKDGQIKALAQKGGVVQVIFYPEFLASSGSTVTVKTVADHIDYIVNLVGVEHVGLGSDFDGATMPVDMQDASMIPQIEKELTGRGYSTDDVKKIMGGNTMRVMKEVWDRAHAEENVDNALVIEPELVMGQAVASDTPILSAGIITDKDTVLDVSSLSVIIDGRIYKPEFDKQTGTVWLQLAQPLMEKFHVVTFQAAGIGGQAVRETRIFHIR